VLMGGLLFVPGVRDPERGRLPAVVVAVSPRDAVGE
jgi:hypothetical protein